MKTRFANRNRMPVIGAEEPATGKLKPIKRHQWEKIADMLKVGGDLADAAAIARISHGRLIRNIEADRHMERDVREIMAECKKHHLQRVYDGERGWQSSAWFLERVYRKQFALQVETTDDQRAIQVRKIVRTKGRRPTLQDALEPTPN